MPRYTFEQFASVRNYGDLTFSPDGRSVAYTTNASGQYNVWRQPVETGPGGHPLMPVQLTALTDDAARRAVWSPDGERLLTMADHHGTENYQIYEIPAEHGWLYPLTEGAEVRHELGPEPFSPDGRAIIYASNERTRADFDIFMRDLSAGEGRPLMTDGAYYVPASWSPDGRSILVIKLNSNTDQDLFLCDAATGERRHLTPHEGEIEFSPGPWCPDGRGFWILTDRDREFTGLAFYDLQRGDIEWVETPEWDVQGVAASRDGRWLAWIVNEGGWSRLRVRDGASGATREFPDLPRGVYGLPRFSPAGPTLGLSIARPTGPAQLYVLDVETGQATRLTQSFLGGIPETEMVEPESVDFPGADGRRIPAFLYRPRGLAAGERVPVVLSIHGGPESQELPNYAYNGL